MCSDVTARRFSTLPAVTGAQFGLQRNGEEPMPLSGVLNLESKLFK